MLKHFLINRIAQILHPLTQFSHHQKTVLMIAIDALLLPICFYLAYFFRVGNLLQISHTTLYLGILTTFFSILIFAFSGLYKAVVRYIELRVVVQSVLALAIVVLLIYLPLRLTEISIPRTTLFVYWFIAFSYVICSRFAARWVLRLQQGIDIKLKNFVAIIGAGEAGVQLMKNDAHYQTVCFFDDNKSLQGKKISGLSIYPIEAIPKIIQEIKITQIALAIPSLSFTEKKQLLAKLTPLGLPIQTLPNLVDLVSGKITADTLRPIELEDLLGRESIPPEHSLFDRCIQQKNVLVTGAGGSIGSEICRQVMHAHPSKLILLDHSEFALYAIEHELKTKYPAVELHAILATVTNTDLLIQLCRQHSINTLYHAAAYKHVPIIEENMIAGIQNNILGSLSVAKVCIAAQVKHCVLISTDKAVRPTNIMGATKRVAEQIFQAYAQQYSDTTIFAIVRFGNVLGSSGSVVPLFKEQIRTGGPVTVTHPEITRFFMLIPEAAQLVIQAGAMAQGGEVFLLDMGKPVKVFELAEQMIKLSGFTPKTIDQPHGDIEIKITGLRPGEKLFEELLIDDTAQASQHPRIFYANEKGIAYQYLQTMLEPLHLHCKNNDDNASRQILKKLVPEYQNESF